jgi:head-tail adaptor
MPAAKRRDPITVQRLKSSATNDPATGEMAVENESNWEDFLVTFGEVLVKGQREFTRAGIVDADVSHLVRIPLSTETAAITSQMRIFLHTTGEHLHVMEAYRRDTSNRETEVICRS